MEKTLRSLFDFQRFAGNGELAKMIEETVNRHGTELTEDDLSLVSAAGLPESPDSENNHLNSLHFDGENGRIGN